jgi:ribosome maturation factor RimP
MDVSGFRQHIRDTVGDTITRLGFDLVAVELTADQAGNLLRLSVDGPNGISVAECTLISRHLTPLIDEVDPVEGAYRLEVSSPGIKRPVQRISDFQRFTGYRVKIRLYEGVGRRRFTGDIVRVDSEDIFVSVDGTEHGVPFTDIEMAHLQLDIEQFQALAQMANPPTGESV